MEPTAQNMLDERQVAEMLGVSPQTLARWRCLGVGPTYSKMVRVVRYDARDVQTFIAAGRRQRVEAV